MSLFEAFKNIFFFFTIFDFSVATVLYILFHAVLQSRVVPIGYQKKGFFFWKSFCVAHSITMERSACCWLGIQTTAFSAVLAFSCVQLFFCPSTGCYSQHKPITSQKVHLKYMLCRCFIRLHGLRVYLVGMAQYPFFMSKTHTTAFSIDR